jgi:hypothetical protein
MPQTCVSLHLLGNLRATVRYSTSDSAVQQSSCAGRQRAVLRTVAAGHAGSIAFNAMAGGEPRGSFVPSAAHASAGHVAASDRCSHGPLAGATWRLRTPRRKVLPWLVLSGLEGHVAAPDPSAVWRDTWRLRTPRRRVLPRLTLSDPEALEEVRDPTVMGSGPASWGCRVPLPMAHGSAGPVLEQGPGPEVLDGWAAQPVKHIGRAFLRYTNECS